MNDTPPTAFISRLLQKKPFQPLSPKQVAIEAIYSLDPLQFGVAEFTHTQRMISLRERYGFTPEELADQRIRTGTVSERKEIISRMREVDAELNDICGIFAELIRREGDYVQAYVEARLTPGDREAQDRWDQQHLALGRFYGEAGLSMEDTKKTLQGIRQHGDAEIACHRGDVGRC